jgi:hypothetical protein
MTSMNGDMFTHKNVNKQCSSARVTLFPEIYPIHHLKVKVIK